VFTQSCVLGVDNIRASVDAFEVAKVEPQTGCARLLSSLSVNKSINGSGEEEHVISTILLNERRIGRSLKRNQREYPVIIIH